MMCFKSVLTVSLMTKLSGFVQIHCWRFVPCNSRSHHFFVGYKASQNARFMPLGFPHIIRSICSRIVWSVRSCEKMLRSIYHPGFTCHLIVTPHGFPTRCHHFLALAAAASLRRAGVLPNARTDGWLTLFFRPPACAKPWKTCSNSTCGTNNFNC